LDTRPYNSYILQSVTVEGSTFTSKKITWSL